MEEVKKEYLPMKTGNKSGGKISNVIFINQSMKSKISFPGLVFSLMFFASMYQTKEFTDPFLMPKHYFMAFAALLFIAVALIFQILKKEKSTYNITKTDIALSIYVLYNTIYYVVQGENPLFEVRLLSQYILLLGYFVVKPFIELQSSAENESGFVKTVLGVSFVLAIIQSLYGLAQYFEISERLQTEFEIGGAYGNPGPYSNFLVVLLPFTLAFSLFKPKSILKYLALTATVLIIIVLPLTKARTAWISAIIVIVYVVFYTKPVQQVWNKYFKTFSRRILLVTIAIILLVGGIWALTAFKQESASGRLFIWKVTLQMVEDKPVLGHGYASYAAAHNNYQADYFRNNPNDWDNAYLADGINYAFNEFLQIASETGVLGLALFALIFIYAISGSRNKKDGENNKLLIAVEGSLIAILVTSLFSYPLQDVAILSVMFFNLAILSVHKNSNVYTLRRSAGARKIMVIATFVILVLFAHLELKRFNAEKRWAYTFKLVRKGKYDIAKQRYDELLPILKYNQYFMFNYGAELTVMGEYKKSVEVLEQVEHRLNDSDFYIYLGSSYEGLGNIDMALQCFEQAANIMPVKFFPKYKIVLLHRVQGNNAKAVEMARHIMEMPIKVDSDIVRSIRHEMDVFLSGNQQN